MTKERFLPIGIQIFSDIREHNTIYIDKTAFIYKLATEGQSYFLSRPHCFGKSLLLSTMKAYFEGKKELFTGLTIEKLEKDWIEYPIIYLNFSQTNFTINENLQTFLNSFLSEYEEKYHIVKKENDFALRFSQIIQKVNEFTGKQVVILIDEYDKPILDVLYTEYEKQNHETLSSFYSPLKTCSQYIKFLFITGITHISFNNIFSGLNQLNNISFQEKYSSICGVSESELEQYFMPEIEKLAKKQEITIQDIKAELAKMYGGYHFAPNSEDIYNPFSLLKCFSELNFGSYWFKNDIISFLAKTLKNQPSQLLSIMNERKSTEDRFKVYELDSKNMLPVIYQNGYLTIKNFEETKNDHIYTLGFPNKEVENGFLNTILPKFISVPDADLNIFVNSLRKAFAAGDLKIAMQIIKSCFADIPIILQKNMCENFYATITQVLFRMTGFNVDSEIQLIFGLSNITLTTQTDVYIFELKTVAPGNFEKGVKEALAQIEKRNYEERYGVNGKTTHKIALVFANDASGVLDWREENRFQLK